MAPRVRLNPEQRRAQLIELGVRMLATSTIDELSIDALAAEAGISRGLLFHYFRSKREFHLAVAQAAADELLRCTEIDPKLEPMAMAIHGLESFVDYVTANRDAYVSLIRGARSGDADMREISDNTRATLAQRILDQSHQVGLSRSPATTLIVRAWLAFVEEAVVQWLAAEAMSREELLRVLTASFGYLLDISAAKTE